MTIKLPDIPFSSFLYVTTAGHLVFAIPVIGIIWVLNLMDTNTLLFVLAPIVLISIPVSAAFSWLIAKGSNWVNTSAAITAACSLPGRIYGALFGGLLGSHFFSIVGGVFTAIVFYLIALAMTIPLGKFLAGKVVLAPDSEKTSSLS